MFFKRLTKSKSASVTPVDPRPEATAPEKAGPQPLAAADLRRTVVSKDLGFKTTAELTPASGLAGQDRALAAIDFGLSMRARDFNIFVVGVSSSAKSAAMRAHLAKVAAESQTPSDWIYVNNFSDPQRPKALSLPAGRANALAAGIRDALAEIAAALPSAYASEDYRARRRAIDEEFSSSQDDALDGIQSRAAQQNIAVIRTPRGFTMAPMHDGKVVRAEVFSQLPDAMRRDVEKRIGILQGELEAVLSNAPKAEKQRRTQLADLHADVTRQIVEEALDILSSTFADLPEIATFLADVEADLVASSAQFALADSGRQPARDAADDERLRRYLVNVLVSHPDAKTGAPIVEAPNPTLGNLIGFVAQDGRSELPTDFLSIRPGALHLANGGALMLDARRVLASREAWDALKRALESGEIRIEAATSAEAGAATPLAFEPAPIPLAIKVVLFVDAEQLETIQDTDPDFLHLFKVQAELDDSIGRTVDNDKLFARLVASLIDTHSLKPVDASGVARLMEEAARWAEDRDKLSIEIEKLADILREADYWAEGESRKTKVITASDIARALKERSRRGDRQREQAQESLERGVVLVDTAGTKVGQINALSLVQRGQLSFGRPVRITARVHLGQGRVTDIEREVELGGPLHSKGVMILWGYLAGRFAQDVPLSLAATLVFEQSYDLIEGDSASAAELCALLSALADAPLRQELAVTGSVNQWGDMQAVGGINDKIEGYFDVCVGRGLSGTQGIIIPAANRQHLMLREDVVEAVRDGKFAIYAVGTVDEAVSLLTGLEAGDRGSDGHFGAATVNGRVDARLKTFAERVRSFSNGKVGAAAGPA